MATLVSKTRTVRSIPLDLLRRGKIHKIPLYYLLLSSDFAKEAIENQGSGRLLDMVYQNRADGRYGIGGVITRYLLDLPVSFAFRNRFEITKACLISQVNSLPSETEVRVLSLPCGFSRDILDAAAALKDRSVRFTGIDLDPVSIVHSRSDASLRGVASARFIQDDIFEFLGKTPERFDIVLSNGFSDYLSPDEAVSYYNNLQRVLAPRGVLITSGIGPHPHMKSVLQDFTGITGYYRTASEVEAVLAKTRFTSISLWSESRNIITMALCRS